MIVVNSYLINSEYNFKGEWWQSIDHSVKFSGELKYLPTEDKVELSIWGDSKLKEIDFYNDTFLGITTDNKYITLTYLQRRYTSTTGAIDRKYYHVIDVGGAVLIGTHATSIKDIRFTNIACNFSDQINFIQRNGFNFDDSSGKLSYSYQPLDSIVVYDDGSLKIDLHFAHSYHLFSKLSQEATMKQTEYFHISTKENSLEYGKLIDQMIVLRNFISFCTNKNVHVTECYFFEYSDNRLVNRVFMLNHSVARNDEKKSHYSPSYIMLTLDDIESKKVVYGDWIKLYKIKQTALVIFFSLKYQRRLFLEEEFLSLMHAIEDYHRHSVEYRQGIDPEDVYESKINSILSACPEEHKKWLKKKLKYSNEINLRWRMNSIFSKYSVQVERMMNDNITIQKIVDKIVATRNYLSHRSEESKEQAIKNYESYFYLNDLLKTILILMILSDLNIDEEEINNKIYSVPEFNSGIKVEWAHVE